MAFNGAGVYNRTYDWTDDKAAGTKIRADRMDTEMDGFAEGLSNCICRDGQSTITADIPMNSHKLTGLAAGSSAGDSVRYEQVVLLSAGASQTITRSTIGDVIVLESTEAGASLGPSLTLYRNSASPAASDAIGGLLFDGEDSAGNRTTYGGVVAYIIDPTNSSEDGILVFRAVTAGTLADILALSGAALYSNTSDQLSLGTPSKMWSDLFLASGGVINWNNGDVTATHAANALAFAGATSGYSFADGPIVPGTSNGAAIGTTTLMWSDLFLASGGVINWNNGDVTLTHSANALAFAGATSGYSFDDDLLLPSGGVINFNSGDVTLTHSSNSLALAGGALTIEGANVEPGASRCSFSAHKNGSDQNVANNNATKVTFGTEAFDVGTKFASSTWTPPAGTVSMTAVVTLSSIASGGPAPQIFIYKNGSAFKRVIGLTDSIESLKITVIDQCNGTDTYEVYVVLSANGSTISGNAAYTYFSGTMV